MALKLCSLFDGIAGFPLSASRHGITPVSASEIEPYPIAVSRRHFPNMKHLGSVTDIDGASIEPVDIVSFGSPCQDLSLAGKRRGLGTDTTRAARFHIKAAPDGWKDRQQTMTGEVWSDIAATFSARKATRSGLFFHAVRIIEEMREATRDAKEGPKPTLAVWENVPGAFSSNAGRDFAAVLQRLVGGAVDVPRGGWSNAGVAFGPKGQAAWRVLDAQFWGVPQRRRRIFLVADFGGERAGQILFEPYGVSGDSQAGEEEGQGIAAGPPDSVGAESAVARALGHGRYTNDGTTGSLKARDYKRGTIDVVVQPQLYDTTHADEAMVPVASCDFRSGTETPEVSSTLQSARKGYAFNSQPPVRIGYTVRRLTPTECERLQGYRDGWTEWGVDEQGNRINGSDTARYKALGNSVARPPVEFIMGRISEVLLAGD